MSEQMLIDYCAPTLASIKTANLFRCRAKDCDEVKKTVDAWNRALHEKGVSFRILRERKGEALIYVCRRSRLERELARSDTAAFLAAYGYPEGCGTQQALERLTSRMANEEQFPHEIGVFLGYPLEDVVAFIENGGKNCKCVGAWKVYGDVRAAQMTFARYRKCREIYSRLFSEGKTVQQLTIVA